MESQHAGEGAPPGSRTPLTRKWRWYAAGAAAAAVLGLGWLFLFGLPGRDSTPTEELPRQAEQSATAPAAGMHSLVATETMRVYYLGDAGRGRLAYQLDRQLWYESPRRQRIEDRYTEWATDGSVLAQQAMVTVWDGARYWSYDETGATATVYTQDPHADPFSGPTGAQLLLGDPSQLLGLIAKGSDCASAHVAGQERVAGRAAHVLELGPQRCGFVLPGGDGPQTLWIDQQTGLLLKSERHALNGSLAAVVEVRDIEVNRPIDGQRFSFTPGSEVKLTDRGSATFSPRTTPNIPGSLATAKQTATFDVREPAELPAGYQLQWVQHSWPDQASQDRPTSTNDWVLLRYADARGNWLMIADGYGGIIQGLVSMAPTTVPQGTVTVAGQQARWVRGSPLVSVLWDTGTMTALSWQAGTAASTGSPRYTGLASNVLSVDELRAVAESLH